MSRCVAMSQELAEVALGRPASEALSNHLEKCASCATELARQRAILQRIDATVLALVRGEPSGQLLGGITARLRSAAPHWWSRQWVGIAVGAAIAASVAMMVGLRALQPHAMPGSSTDGLTTWRSPTAVLLEPQGSVLHAPLQDIWFDLGSGLSHSKPFRGETHGT